MPNLVNLKIEDGGGRHLEFQENVNNFVEDQDDASRPCGDDRMTKSRNRKLIRVTSSNKRLEHKFGDRCDYNEYLN